MGYDVKRFERIAIGHNIVQLNMEIMFLALQG